VSQLVRPGCGTGGVSSAAAHALAYTVTQQIVTAGTSIVVAYDHFETTDESVFATELDALGQNNAPGDDHLMILADGFLVAESAVLMESALYARYGLIDGSPGHFVHGSSEASDSSLAFASTGGVLWLVDQLVDWADAGSALGVRAYNGDAVDHTVDKAYFSVLWFSRSAPATVIY